ncbi:oxidoreductase, short chain dehydrogenase/reductase family protein [Necator americanus]|uniref:Oxidoreductase, short chain dehydrogenase/reductase family protein n=1 Tax=Necator americanus TaxID=51031 RepID=W2TLH8_NECAM|nr:oxidoreductase, short chain dehydrogenase/reductase family protein [Necator americanus]ETN81996.1 oxidoreductase, short chain dehydrogenase/reductase family protein [Necator americanus]
MPSFKNQYRLCTYLIPGPHRHPKLSFKDKTVLITGASSGLGRALAFELYRRGAKVIVTARSIDKLKGLCEELKRSGIENPHEPSYSYLDVSEPMDVEALKNLAIDGKTIHVLINNAGLSMRGSINDTPISIYKQLMDVNFFGHVVITQKLLNSIPDDGCIIATSSVQGKLPIPYRSAYGASKHAFQAFFDALRCESRPNMHILTVSAGYMNTGFGKRALDTQGHAVGKEDEKQLKGLSPEEAANIILRAASARETDLVMAPFSNKIAIFLRWAWPSLLFYLLYKRGLKDEYATKKSQ